MPDVADATLFASRLDTASVASTATVVDFSLQDPNSLNSGSASPVSLLRQALRERAILCGQQQRLIGPRGGRKDWLLDVRRLMLEPRLLDAYAELFFELLGEDLPFQVGGLEMGAVPLVAAILMKSVERGTPVNGFVIRKERKTHGTGSLIEGTLTDAPIIIVDDIVNSASSLEKIRVVLAVQGRAIAQVFTLVDYHNPAGHAWRCLHGIVVRAAFVLADLGLTPRKPVQPPEQTRFEDVWNFAAPDPNCFHRVPKSFPATDGRRVCFGSDSGVFWCLSATDGSVLWTFKVNTGGHKNLWSAPALYDNKVFFGSYDGNVYCLDMETGAELWRFIGADWVGSSPTIAPELNVLFIGLEFAVEGRRGSIVALDLSSGEKVWEHPTKRYTHASPAFCSERRLVACGSNDNELFLLDALTGAVRWRFDTSGTGSSTASIRHAPAFDPKRGQLIAGCANGYAYVIEVQTGREVWSVRTGNSIYTVPLVVEDSAYFGSTDKHFYVLDLERREVRNRIHTGAKIFGPPRLIGGRIYFGACNGLIYELEPATAAITGTHQLPDAVTNALCYSFETGLLYALTYVNQLFAFRRASAAAPLSRAPVPL